MLVYQIAFRKRALKEYVKAAGWYKEHSLQAAENFVKIINTTTQSIASYPYRYRNPYKYFYEAKTRGYPYHIVYIIDEVKQQVVITTIFHQKRNPIKKYR